MYIQTVYVSSESSHESVHLCRLAQVELLKDFGLPIMLTQTVANHAEFGRPHIYNMVVYNIRNALCHHEADCGATVITGIRIVLLRTSISEPVFVFTPYNIVGN